MLRWIKLHNNTEESGKQGKVKEKERESEDNEKRKEGRTV